MLRRMDESFGRLTVAQLYTLLVEAEVPEASPPVSYDDGTGPRRVAHGAEDEAEYTSPLMLVDVRDRAAFDECHIMSGEGGRACPQPSRWRLCSRRWPMAPGLGHLPAAGLHPPWLPHRPPHLAPSTP